MRNTTIAALVTLLAACGGGGDGLEPPATAIPDLGCRVSAIETGGVGLVVQPGTFGEFGNPVAFPRAGDYTVELRARVAGTGRLRVMLSYSGRGVSDSEPCDVDVAGGAEVSYVIRVRAEEPEPWQIVPVFSGGAFVVTDHAITLY